MLLYLRHINKVLVYSEKQSNRLTYIVRTLLGEGLGLSVKVVTDLKEFNFGDHARINYSNQVLDKCITIRPHTILFDHGIRDYHLQVSSSDRFYKIFFKNAEDEVPFDLLGASFWLLSRYEEYLPYKADTQNRFHYRSSLAYQYDFLQIPLVNLWLEALRSCLSRHFPSLEFVSRTYSYISSIDIDNAYKYKYKGFVRTMAGVLSDRKLSKIKERFTIILGRKKDPFDCYDYLIETHRQIGVKAIYFFLLGDYGPNDKNHSASDLRFQKLIKHLTDYSMAGVHPSYGSNFNLKQLKKEVSRLTNTVHRVITKSRQHFSMLKFPQTYQDLLQAGITSDYTLGFTARNGFRASYCYPYKWYSLDIESVSSLTIHPFCISDNALLSQTQPEIKEMLKIVEPIISEVKKYNGELITLFHNDNFDERMKKVYPEILKAAKEPDQAY